MKTPDDNKKLYNYSDGRCIRMGYIYGNHQAVKAIADGFIWVTSTNTHDVYFNRQVSVYRAINKDTKNFYEYRKAQ